MSLLVLAFLLLPPHGGQQQNPANHNANKPANTNQSNPVQRGAEPPNQENSPTANSPHKLPWWKDEAEATWALVVVGILGTVAALWTLCILWTQTEHIVRSERAWIMVQEPEGINTWEHTSIKSGIESQSTSLSFVLRYKNEGKTPAWITDKRIHFSIVEELPPEPIFDETSLKFSYPEPEPIGVGQELTLEAKYIETPGVHVMVLSGQGGNVPILYGIIKYRDAFSKTERETRFGYQIKGRDRIDRIHSLRYNNNT